MFTNFFAIWGVLWRVHMKVISSLRHSDAPRNLLASQDFERGRHIFCFSRVGLLNLDKKEFIPWLRNRKEPTEFRFGRSIGSYFSWFLRQTDNIRNSLVLLAAPEQFFSLRINPRILSPCNTCSHSKSVLVLCRHHNFVSLMKIFACCR